MRGMLEVGGPGDPRDFPWVGGARRANRKMSHLFVRRVK